MDFTYSDYLKLIDHIKNNGYTMCGYNDWKKYDRCVILRHDIDYDLNKAVQMAEIENENGIKSTYFVLLTSDFYNVFSRDNTSVLIKIAELGHELGLHFDEDRYPEIKSAEGYIDNILRESRILSELVGTPMDVVAMHRPGDEMLRADLHIPGMINTYGSVYFKEFKYLSDSRRRWRESVETIVESRQYNRLQILTHAFWYDHINRDIHETIKAFIDCACIDRYKAISRNITDIDSIIDVKEVYGG